MRSNRWMSIADPIHGIIRFDRNDETHRLLLEVMNSRAFQRLRRIKQMGLAEFVFPNAVHSRFVHSLGATHLMIQTLEHFNHSRTTRKILESPFEDTGVPLYRLLLLGILLHDIGHSPLSHTLEDVLELKDQGLHHDTYWNQKIITEDPELLAIWQKYDPNLPNAFSRFISDGRNRHFLSYLISSQLDMDRLDYLQRDSHFLGVKYGQIEVQRIIQNLEIVELRPGRPVVAIREEAIPAVEHYLFGRHEAYKMALHSLDKASEATLKLTLRRFAWARQNNIATGEPLEALYKLMVDGKNLPIRDYLRLDDYTIWEAIKRWSDESEDELLRQLADRMMTHDILKFVDLASYRFEGDLKDIPSVYEALKQYYAQRGLCFEFGFEETHVKPKPLYLGKANREPIWISTRNGVKDLMDLSTLPLEQEASRGQKHLLFVWDREARTFLQDALNAHFGTDKPEDDEMSV